MNKKKLKKSVIYGSGEKEGLSGRRILNFGGEDEHFLVDL